MKLAICSAIVLAIALVPNVAGAKTLTVAVIDTGIDNVSVNTKVCKSGHKSFTPNGDALVDTHGHGTHIAGLIREYGGNRNFCMVAIQFYDPAVSGRQNTSNMRGALRYAINLHVDMINISGGGPDADTEERALIKKALDQGITVVVAAGNEGHNLSLDCNYYPACYDRRIIVVGNIMQDHSRSPSSNYGSYVSRWEVGTNVTSTWPGKRLNTVSGTSQATAIATGKIIRTKLREQ